MRSSERTATVLGETNVCFEFHIPSFQRDVGAEFDRDKFTAQLERANVDTILFEAKGAHGHSYYDTDVGNRHPNLEGDLFGEILDACHERGIEVQTYYCLAWDDISGIGNPDWYQHDGNSERLEAGGEENLWDYLCLNSPYTEELVHPQVRELLERYDVDALFFDILVYHPDACMCPYCRKSMRADGLDPDDPDDRRTHRKRVVRRFAERTTELVKDYDEDVVVTYNHPLELGLTSTLSEHLDYVLIESLPAGWGYLHTPMYARYARNLDRPVQGMTGVFHRMWGDYGSVKNDRQLQYELAASLVHHLPVSVGDQLLPRGELIDARYDVIGDAFDFAKERVVGDAEPLRDIAVISPGSEDPVSGGGTEQLTVQTSGLAGATKFLLDTHQQFDVLDEQLAQILLEAEDFSVVVLPGTGELDPGTIDTVRSFVEDGGSLVATADSSKVGGEFALEDVLGIKSQGQLPYSNAYIDLDDYDDGVPAFPCIAYGRFETVTLDGATERATVVRPTSERSTTRRFSHFQAPPEAELDVPAITANEYGDGNGIYVGTDLFRQYYQEDYYVHRTILDNILGTVQPDRVLAAEAPPSVEVNAMTDGENSYVHATNFQVNRPGESLPRIEEVTPVRDMTIYLRSDRTTVTPVTDVGISTERDADVLEIMLDEVHLHEIVAVS